MQTAGTTSLLVIDSDAFNGCGWKGMPRSEQRADSIVAADLVKFSAPAPDPCARFAHRVGPMATSAMSSRGSPGCASTAARSTHSTSS